MKETKVLGIRYYGSTMKEYHQVADLAKKNELTLSDVGRILIKKGIKNSNPHLIDKTTEAPVKVKSEVVNKPNSVAKTVVAPVNTKPAVASKPDVGKTPVDKVKTIEIIEPDTIKSEVEKITANNIKEVVKTQVNERNKDSSTSSWIVGLGILGIVGYGIYKWSKKRKIEAKLETGKKPLFIENKPANGSAFPIIREY